MGQWGLYIVCPRYLFQPIRWQFKLNSPWKWVTSEPSFLGDICNLCSRFIGYLCHLKPTCGSIDHCEAPKFKQVFNFSRDRVWAHEVYTKRVPGVCFILFRWQLAIFLISCFRSLACWALLTQFMDCFTKAFTVEMLTESMLYVSLSMLIDHLVIPIYSFLL